MVYKYRRILLIKNMVDGMNITTFILGCDSLDETLIKPIHFIPFVPFYALWKYQETKAFLIFSGDIKRYQWHEMG